MQRVAGVALLMALAALTDACASNLPRGVESNPAALAQQAPERSFEHKVEANARDMLKEGKQIFRYDTFGSDRALFPRAEARAQRRRES